MVRINGVLRCEIQRMADRQCFQLIGELDYSGRDEVVQILAAATSPTIEVNLSELCFIDASGLSALLAAREIVEARKGREINFRSPSHQVSQLVGLLELGARLFE
jgi:anti-anti-sigma factor